MPKPRVGAALFSLSVSLSLAIAGQGCKGCEKPPPDPGMPDASEPSALPPPTVDLTPPPVDASDDGDAAGDADAKKAVGGGTDLTRLRACCNALAANAASMPLPQSTYAAAAAAYCQASVASVSSPGQKDQMIAAIRAKLQGSQLPAACH